MPLTPVAGPAGVIVDVGAPAETVVCAATCELAAERSSDKDVRMLAASRVFVCDRFYTTDWIREVVEVVRSRH